MLLLFWQNAQVEYSVTLCYGVDPYKHDFTRILWMNEISYYRKVYFNRAYHLCLNWRVFVTIWGVLNVCHLVYVHKKSSDPDYPCALVTFLPGHMKKEERFAQIHGVLYKEIHCKWKYKKSISISNRQTLLCLFFPLIKCSRSNSLVIINCIFYYRI